MNVEVEFEDNSESDYDMEESEIFENDEGYYRIVFNINGEQVALADYTYERGYDVVEYTPEKFSDADLKASIKQLKDM